MKQIVFYSWQSDLPNSCNRGFIQGALENVAASITADDTVEIEPVVDRDTQGIPGAPDIASTIFSKITAADVFVADVSITAKNDKRATPNPNVLIELGYAMKALGPERVILVFNRAFGKIEELPFDLRMRRVLVYDLPAGSPEKSSERKVVEKHLDNAIRTALATHHDAKNQRSIPAIAVIESQQANRIIVLRRNLADILERLTELEPKKHSAGGTSGDLINALARTQEIVAEFSKVAETISTMNDQDAALELQRWFGGLFEKYNFPENFSGKSTNADHDYFKFLGHELYVSFISFLLREERWQILQQVLSQPISLRYSRRAHGPANVDWTFASDHLPSLLDESQKRKRVSLHADLLNERHTKGGLATIAPIDDFMAADYFLFLLGAIPPRESSLRYFAWRPWSTLYLKSAPMFLRNAEYRRVATPLVGLFQVPSIDEFKSQLLECSQELGRLFKDLFWDDPLEVEVVRKIATR